MKTKKTLPDSVSSWKLLYFYLLSALNLQLQLNNRSPCHPTICWTKYRLTFYQASFHSFTHTPEVIYSVVSARYYCIQYILLMSHFELNKKSRNPLKKFNQQLFPCFVILERSPVVTLLGHRMLVIISQMLVVVETLQTQILVAVSPSIILALIIIVGIVIAE